MLEDVYCKVLCQQTLKNDHAESFRKSVQVRALAYMLCHTLILFLSMLMQHFYHNNWIIDNLPSASILDSDHFITTEYIGTVMDMICVDCICIVKHFTTNEDI